MVGAAPLAAIRRIVYGKKTALRIPVSLVAAMAVLVAAACSSPGAPTSAGPAAQSSSSESGKAVVAPDSLAGAQLRWLNAALPRLPLSDAELRAHFNPSLLTMVGGTAALNDSLQSPAAAQLLSVKLSEPSMVIAFVSFGPRPPVRVTLVVDSRALIGGLDSSRVVPEPVPTSWPGVDAALRSVAAPDSLAWHPHGMYTPTGYAAIGAAEGLVHSTDIAAGLGLAWMPSDAAVAPVLDTVFPGTRRPEEPPLPALLRATGRGPDPTPGRWTYSAAATRI